MAYRAYRSDRRPRGRRWLLIVVSLVAVISVTVVLASRQTEQRGAVEFFAAADESAELHVQASSELETALASIGVIERQVLVRQLERMALDAAEADLILDVEVPSSIGASYGTMTTASSAWSSGAADVRSTIAAIMDGTLVEGAQQQLERALDELRVGDMAHGLFLDTLSTVGDHVDLPVFSAVTYINLDTQDPLLYDAQTLVIRIQTSYNLSPHSDVAVVGMMEPSAIGDSDGIPVVPFSETLDVVAIVSNEGNEDEAAVSILLEIFNIDTGATISEVKEIRDLAAGASTTVTFTDVDITPGGLYQSKVTVTIDDDIDPDNNEWSMTFIWRSES